MRVHCVVVLPSKKLVCIMPTAMTSRCEFHDVGPPTWSTTESTFFLACGPVPLDSPPCPETKNQLSTPGPREKSKAPHLALSISILWFIALNFCNILSSVQRNIGNEETFVNILFTCIRLGIFIPMAITCKTTGKGKSHTVVNTSHAEEREYILSMQRFSFKLCDVVSSKFDW